MEKLPEFNSVACIGGIRAEALQRTFLLSNDSKARVGEVNNVKLDQAWEYIRQHPKCKAVMVARHIQVAHTTFRTHYVPELRRRGVGNKGDGYFI